MRDSSSGEICSSLKMIVQEYLKLHHDFPLFFVRIFSIFHHDITLLFFSLSDCHDDRQDSLLSEYLFPLFYPSQIFSPSLYSILLALLRVLINLPLNDVSSLLSFFPSYVLLKKPHFSFLTLHLISSYLYRQKEYFFFFGKVSVHHFVFPKPTSLNHSIVKTIQYDTP